MNRKNKMKIVLAAACGALAAIIGLAAVTTVNGKMKERRYEEAIDSAQKLLAQGDDEESVVLLKEAISINPEDAEAYLELADVYMRMSERSKALSILRKGYKATESVKIKRRINQLETTGVAAAESGNLKNMAANSDLDLAAASEDIAWNTSFLQKLTNYTYENYKDEYGAAPSVLRDGEGYLEVRHRGFFGVCYYKNTYDNNQVVDESRKLPREGGMPQKVTLDTLELIFRNFEGAASLERLQMLFGERVRPQTSAERTYIEKDMGEYVIRIETDANGNIVSAHAWNEIILPNANLKKNQGSRLEGVVVDAVSGDGVREARLEFAPVRGNGVVTVTTAGSGGEFSVDLEPGSYVVTISAGDYITEGFEVEIVEGKTKSGEQFILSPELTAGAARIVLEWNAEPQDLDSYLDGRTDAGDRVHTNFRNKTASSSGEVIAELDLDDVNGYGPETTTIYDLKGEYTFTVVDFQSTGTMSAYGATVKVYLPGKPVETITLQTGAGVEDVWEVCRIDHGELEILNRAGAGAGEGY